MGKLHEATVLAFQIWAYIGGIALVLWIINKLVAANKVFEGTKNIPGGKYYKEPRPTHEQTELTPEEEEAFTELSWRAHA